jgi:hypothetical protein
MKIKFTEEQMKFFRAKGKKGGKIGGKARAAKMTAKQRIAQAKKAAEARWGKK